MALSEATSMKEIAARIREMREISGYSQAEMAEKAEVSLADYEKYEPGSWTSPSRSFTNVRRPSMWRLPSFWKAKALSFPLIRSPARATVSRPPAKRAFFIDNMAPNFRNKLAEPYYVKYDYREELQDLPIHTTTHPGQEF